MSLVTLYLKKNEERRIRAGHLWIYSNEIDVQRSPIRGLEPGSLVRVLGHKDQPLGIGTVNPASLIAVRLLSRNIEQSIDQGFFERRLQRALSLRESVLGGDCFRWVYGEGDRLPGLVIDRYGSHCVVQLNTAGMQALREQVVAAIRTVCQPESILLRCDSRAREMEGLDSYVEQGFGVTPEQVRVSEGALELQVPLHAGQKTGWFFDQRLNRELVARHAQGRKVLDVFCYLGGFGLSAARAGASRVDCMDQSESALEILEQNAQEMGVQERIATFPGDAFAGLKRLADAGEKYDLIVLDPPALIQRKKDLKEGELAYLRLNTLCMSLLAEGGLLLTCSCSQHLDRDRLTDLVRRAALKTGRSAAILAEGGQGPDHPVHPSIRETAYLKSCLVHA